MSIIINFKPAYISDGKETIVVYYALEPVSDKLVRKKIKLNHIKDRSDRLKYARKLCVELNKKLLGGWSPFSPYGTARDMSLEKAMELFQDEKGKELRLDSIRCYNSYIKLFQQFIKGVKIQSISPTDFSCALANNYMLTVSGQVSARTYNGYLRFQKTFFNWLIDKNICQVNPFKNIKPKRVDEKIRTTIPSDVRHKIEDYFRSIHKEEFIVFMKATYRCFIRPKELCQIRMEDYNPSNGILTIPAKVAKNHKARKVALTSDLAEYFNKLEAPNFYYIFSTQWKPGKRLMTTRESGKEWAKMRIALGLPMCYQFYSLKDSGITEMLEAGVPAKFVKELADHASLTTTEKYNQASQAESRKQYSEDLLF
jgi:integrase